MRTRRNDALCVRRAQNIRKISFSSEAENFIAFSDFIDDELFPSSLIRPPKNLRPAPPDLHKFLIYIVSSFEHIINSTKQLPPPTPFHCPLYDVCPITKNDSKRRRVLAVPSHVVCQREHSCETHCELFALEINFHIRQSTPLSVAHVCRRRLCVRIGTKCVSTALTNSNLVSIDVKRINKISNDVKSSATSALLELAACVLVPFLQ